ncbi:MAG: hypothetical protein A4E53_01328 [Pelotomaculum sp. PtaB.Bin104]|nr:MAG: hypothetical protein A4E53_01328 [Pelotomaculum sp. PtaB.Bin104]
MKISHFIIVLSLIIMVAGCAVEKKEPPNNQGKEVVISMDQAITEYLENKVFPIPPPPGVKTFAAYDLFGLSGNGSEKVAYMWARIEEYGVDPSVGIGPRSASNFPLALILKEENGSFTVTGDHRPGDGSGWWPSVQQIFPAEYHERILNYHRLGKSQELDQTIIEKVNNYLITVGIDNTAASEDETASLDENNFNLILKYGVGAKNILNTFEGIYTKDMILDPPITTKMELTSEELNSIYNKMNEINFFTYPDVFTVPVGTEVGMITPYNSYYFQVRHGSEIKELSWDDEITNQNIDADKLRELVTHIRNLIESKEEYKKLPPARGGYD